MGSNVTKSDNLIELNGGDYMAREKECYRDYLERLDEKFPNKEILPQKECAEFLGIDPRTAKKKYGIGRDGISKCRLARLLS